MAIISLIYIDLHRPITKRFYALKASTSRWKPEVIPYLF
jgi:hypothetical protein